MLNRRTFLSGACGVATAITAGATVRDAIAADGGALNSITAAAQGITPEERQARIAHVQALMGERKVDALLIESGSTLDYFTGITWPRSERTTAAVIPARGRVVVVTPRFEEPSVRESLQVDGEVRPWDEADNPFAAIAQGMTDRGIAAGTLAVEPTVRFFVVEGVRNAAHRGLRVISGAGLVSECRLTKSPAELKLMQTANDVTLAALRFVHDRVVAGMTQQDLAALMDRATASLGATAEFSLVLLNEASAYPHGSEHPESVHDGSIILMDCGCTVHGYQSDISRTWVFGEPTARQRKVWNTVKRGQELVLETARPGTRVGSIDDAVRRFYESEGWGPGYHLPGLPHRTGHGIGLDGHEAAYLVHGDATPLRPGMCFSNEPGIYIPGEFGVRLEDCWHMTPTGPELFTALAKSLEDPI